MLAFLKRLFGLRSRERDASQQQDHYRVQPAIDSQSLDQSAGGERAATGARRMIQGFALLGGLSVIIFALGVSAIQKTEPFWPKFAQTSGTGLLLCLGFFAIGGLFGFLFGIPRASRKNSSAAGSGKQIDPESEGSGSKPYSDNTNLEEISDWLTKIIVGLGLIDLKEIPSQVRRLSEFFAQTCGNDFCSGLFLAIGALFLVAGFVFSYVLTHVYLPVAFTYSGEVEKLKKKQREQGLSISRVNSIALLNEARDEIDNNSEPPSDERFDRGITLLDQALVSNPENVVAYIEKARALKRKALLDQREPEQKVALLKDALELVAKARGLRPKNASAIYNAACYKALLDYPHAEILADLKTAFDLNSKLKEIAPKDTDLKNLWQDEEFKQLTRS
jgi:hypothetical protein